MHVDFFVLAVGIVLFVAWLSVSKMARVIVTEIIFHPFAISHISKVRRGNITEVTVKREAQNKVQLKA